MTKKKFKETRLAAVIKKIGIAGLNFGTGGLQGFTFGLIKSFLDSDKDGKITRQDFRGTNWIKLFGAATGSAIALAVLIKAEIIDLDVALRILETLLSFLLSEG
jgi:hypothetical protein